VDVFVRTILLFSKSHLYLFFDCNNNQELTSAKSPFATITFHIRHLLLNYKRVKAIIIIINKMTGVKSIITLALALTMNPSVYGFSIINHSMKNQRLSTKIFLKDSIADM